MANDDKKGNGHVLVIEELGNPEVVKVIVQVTVLLDVLAEIVTRYGSNGYMVPMSSSKNVTKDCCAFIQFSDLKWDAVTIQWNNSIDEPHCASYDIECGWSIPCLVGCAGDGEAFPYIHDGHPQECPHHAVHITKLPDGRRYMKCADCHLHCGLECMCEISFPVDSWGWTGIVPDHF